MNKILFVDDMKKCYEKTREALGSNFEIDWKDNLLEGIEAITKNFDQYSAGIFDVNLDYDPNLPNNEQTAEGFELINLAKKERDKKGIFFPILCVSSHGEYKNLAFKNGADFFFYKREFWENKKEFLEYLIKKQNK